MVEGGVELRESAGMKLKDLSRAEDLAKEYSEAIIAYWNEHFA